MHYQQWLYKRAFILSEEGKKKMNRNCWQTWKKESSTSLSKHMQSLTIKVSKVTIFTNMHIVQKKRWLFLGRNVSPSVNRGDEYGCWDWVSSQAALDINARTPHTHRHTNTTWTASLSLFHLDFRGLQEGAILLLFLPFRLKGAPAIYTPISRLLPRTSNQQVLHLGFNKVSTPKELSLKTIQIKTRTFCIYQYLSLISTLN